MTLRSFHLFFITISVLLTLFFGVFEWNTYKVAGSMSDAVISALSFISSLGLAIYGIRFRAKSRVNPSSLPS